MTLRDALKLPILRKARLLTGPTLGTGREIGSVSVIEVPVGEFVRSGEFVLSTGMNVGRNQRLLARFVSDVAKAGAAALALAIGPYTPRIPNGIVKTAAGAHLPLIALPWEVRFSEVSEAILRRLIQDQTASRTRHDFVWSLATGNMGEETAAAQAKQLGIDPRLSFVGVFGRGAQTDFVEKLCARAAAERGLQWLGTAAGDSIIGFVQAPHSRLEVHAMLQSLPAPAAVFWGVGRECRGFADFPRSYTDARLACETGARMGGAGHTTDIGNVIADRILLSLARDSDVSLMLDRYVNPLLFLPRLKLVETLEALFAAGNTSQAARQLKISRQALMYRLDRVQLLVGVDLANSEDRFALGLALRLHRLQDPAIA